MKLEMEKLLELEIGKPIIPTVERKIYGKLLVLQLRDGSVITIMNDFGNVEDNLFENMEKFTNYHGKISDFDNINKKILGRTIISKFNEIVNVWIGVL